MHQDFEPEFEQLQNFRMRQPSGNNPFWNSTLFRQFTYLFL